EAAAEERNHSRNAGCTCDLRDVRSRFYAETRDLALDNVTQQISVVACYLYDEAVFVQTEAMHCHVDIFASMCEPRTGERREIGVLGEDLLWWDVFAELNQPARATHLHIERVEHLPGS